MKKAFILGGTGFLGYYTAKELLARGYQVEEVSLPPTPADDLFPAEVKSHLGDIQQYSDEQILQLLEGVYAFVYAAGADERICPDAPATTFFYQANVIPAQRMARLARKAGVKKFVLFNSYFSHFAEQWSDLRLNREQAYPRTRLLQEEVAMFEGGKDMDVMSLRLPYIFGIMPGRTPLWTMFTEQIRGKDTVYVPQGGTAMVTVKQVAEAAVGAIEYGQHEGRYAICDTNMKYLEFYQYMVEALGQTETTKLIVAPIEAFKPTMAQHDEHSRQAGKEHGIHLAVTAEIQGRDAFLDPNDTMPILKMNKDDVVASIRETLKVCVNAKL